MKAQAKWKGRQQLLKEQGEEVKEAFHHLPHLEVGVCVGRVCEW